MIIANKTELLAQGNSRGRLLALEIIDRAMQSVDASILTKSLVSIDSETLRIGGLSYRLSDIDDIYVVGAGKGVVQIAEALDHTLGQRITKGLVIEKRPDGMTRGLERALGLKRIEVLLGGHPVPDVVCVEGARRLLDIVSGAGERDLVFCCVQGGCSSLTTLPAPGLTLQDVQAATDAMLRSGAAIEQLDTLRMAITQLRGGSLARHARPAQIINLVVNDYVWRYPEGWERDARCVGWGPCVPIPEQAQARLAVLTETLRNSDVWGELPASVQNYLLHADLAANVQTVRDLEAAGVKWHTFILADPLTMAEAARCAAQGLGLDSMLLSSAIEGEASQVGTVYAGIAKGIVRSSQPVMPPCAVVLSGEMTVTLPKEHGKGGRNQECVLGAALKIDGSPEIVIASVGTDGTDGPTRIAGGVVDGHTARRASEKGIDLRDQLRRHNSAGVLAELGDAIYFNEAGNNLCDLSIIVVA